MINNIKKKGTSIVFDELAHQYNLKDEKLISVTTLIKMYEPIFDEDGKIAERCAAKEGITVEEIQDKWKKNGEESAAKGTIWHEMAEEIVPNFKEIKSTVNITIGTEEDCKIKALLFEIGAQFEDVTKLPEQVLYSEKYKIAGTADLLTYHESTIDIWDYKSNKKPITPFNTWKKYMKAPIEHIPANDYYKYALQLSIYRLMLEEDGYNVSGLTLIHLNPNSPKTISVPFLKSEALAILEDYNAKKREVCSGIEL